MEKINYYRLYNDKSNDSVIITLPEGLSKDEYLDFGDKGYKLNEILLSIGFTKGKMNFIELGEIKNTDTIINFRHF